MNLLESCEERMDSLLNSFGSDPACEIEINRQQEGCAAEFENAKVRCQYECGYVKKKALEARPKL